MKRIILSIPLVLSVFFLVSVTFPSVVHSEFYEYTDERGVKHFTDDPARIPETRSRKVRVHREVTDGLSEEEKAARMKTEQEELEAARMKQQADMKQREERQKADEEQKQAELEKKKKLEALKTPVVLENNQILVPVTLVNGEKSVTAIMLLDTGATVTNINSTLASQLEINGGKRGRVRVANGSLVKTLQTIIHSMSVGPKTVKSPLITVIEEKGPRRRFDGLLGQDFLKNFEYTIDYKSRHILWKE